MSPVSTKIPGTASWLKICQCNIENDMNDISGHKSALHGYTRAGIL